MAAQAYAQVALRTASSIADCIFDSGSRIEPRPFHLQVKGSNFQVTGWQVLLAIFPGRVVSYQDIAACIGRPKAFRALAKAVAINPPGYLILSHRVIAKSSLAHGYRWGSVRKKRCWDGKPPCKSKQITHLFQLCLDKIANFVSVNFFNTHVFMSG